MNKIMKIFLAIILIGKFAKIYLAHMLNLYLNMNGCLSQGFILFLKNNINDLFDTKCIKQIFECKLWPNPYTFFLMTKTKTTEDSFILITNLQTLDPKFVRVQFHIEYSVLLLETLNPLLKLLPDFKIFKSCQYLACDWSVFHLNLCNLLKISTTL